MDRQNPGGIADAEQDIRRQVAPPARQARRRGGAGGQGRDIHAKTPEIGRLRRGMTEPLIFLRERLGKLAAARKPP
jgi:hypothetical protein